MSGSVITWDTKNKEQRAHRKSEYLIWNIFSIQSGLENTWVIFGVIIKMHYWSRCSTLSWTSEQCLSKCTKLYLNHWSHPYFHPVELIVFLVGPVPPPCPPSDHTLDNNKMVIINPEKRENTMPVWQEGKKNQVSNKQLILRYLLNLFTQIKLFQLSNIIIIEINVI